MGGGLVAPACGPEPNELQNPSFEAFDGAAFPSWAGTSAIQSTSRLDGHYSAQLAAMMGQGIGQTVMRTIPAGATVRACAYTQRVEGMNRPSLVLSVHYAGGPDQVGSFQAPLFAEAWSQAEGSLTTTGEATGADVWIVNEASPVSIHFRVDAAALLVTEP
jgi:hypothetical protein